MSEELYPYYERELLFIRQMAQGFARQYPAAAGRLLLEPNRSADPHVERLIEAFALLSGRIHHKLDDEFPELTEALLSVLYPHYLAPVPSMAVVQFDLDARRTQLPQGFRIERGSRLATQPVGGLRCKFRTAYPVTLWPIALAKAWFQLPPFPEELDLPAKTAMILRLQFECQAAQGFDELDLDQLRLHLFGDQHLCSTLYEFLFNHTSQVTFRGLDAGPAASPVTLSPAECLFPVGFERDEGLLPYPPQSLLGYRLLTEYFAFPQKFLFVDLAGWGKARAGLERKAEVVLAMNRPDKTLLQGVDASTFRLACTPIVNLFEQVAEPITLNHQRHEYRVVPHVAHPLGMEVYSIDSVTSTDPAAHVTTTYQPFYSFRHGQGADERRAFWYAARRPSTTDGDWGSDMFLSLVNLDFDPCLPAESMLLVKTTCTNRDVPTIFRGVGQPVSFELEGAAPLAGIQCLHGPTMPLRPPLARGTYWRLISHLSLNHLSLSDGPAGCQALQEILRLYDFTPSAGRAEMPIVAQRLIDGISDLKASRVVGRVEGGVASGFCRGLEITLEFDEPKYVGAGVYLFASVLERFLGQYVSINSFSQLVAKIKQREGVLKRWPPRAGDRQLL
jgi:type VI secretion system protein ImpG